LYVQYDEYDNALGVMIAHSDVAWEHIQFKDVAVKVKAADTLYKGIAFYLDQHPDLLNDLLKVIESRIDHGRVVDIMKRAGQLALVKQYLLGVQKNNLSAVNDALNQLFIQEGDAAALRESVTNYDNFDQLELAASLEGHELTEFRRLSCLLYEKNLKWKKAVALAKADKLYKDAMETVSKSGDADLAEDLLRFFVDEDQPACFSACLFTAYELVRPDVVMELAWKNQMMDVAMPYMIQTIKDLTGKVDLLMRERNDAIAANKAGEQDRKAQQQAANAYLGLHNHLQLGAGKM